MTALLVCSGFGLVRCARPGKSMASAPTAVAITGSLAIGADDRTLIYSAHAGCRTAALSATETSSSVVLSLSESDAGLGDCVAGLSPEPVAISTLLGDPLRGRPVNDAVSGRRVPYLAENDAPRPRMPVAGWTTIVQGDPMAGVTTGMAYFGGNDSAVLVENFQRIGGQGRLAVVLVSNGGWHPPAGVAVQPITVRGHPGRAASGIIVWTESGRTVAVLGRQQVAGVPPPPEPGISIFAGGEPLTTTQLLAVADTLIGGSR